MQSVSSTLSDIFSALKPSRSSADKDAVVLSGEPLKNLNQGLSQLDHTTKTFLLSKTATDVILSKKPEKPGLLAVSPTTSWQNTLKFLEQHKIFAVPVVEFTGKAPVLANIIEINRVQPQTSDIPVEQAEAMLASLKNNQPTENLEQLNQRSVGSMEKASIITPESQLQQNVQTSNNNTNQMEMGQSGLTSQTLGTSQEATIGRKVTTNVGMMEQTRFKFHGVVSVLDLLFPLATDETFKSMGQCKEEWVNDDKARKQAFDNLLLKKQSFFDEPVMNFIRKDRQQSQLLTEKDSLYTLIECLTKGRHWALVAHKPQSHDPVHFSWISQTDVVNYLEKNKGFLGDIKNKMILQLAPPLRQIYGLDYDARSPVITAFSMLFKYSTDINVDLNAVPLLDNQGRLVGNLSGSDLRGLTSSNAHNLLLPVLQFQKLHPFNADRQSGAFLVTINTSTTLLEAFETVVKNDVHRAWVVNETNNVIAVVTLTDILRALL